MSIAPNPTALDWKKRLPVSVVDWIELDLQRSFADLTQITLEMKPLPLNFATAGGWQQFTGPGLTHYTFTFSDGKTFETDADPLSHLWLTKLIDGYNDIISPHVWIDHYIMQIQRDDEDFMDYGIASNAYAMAAHVLKRCDALAMAFARNLVKDDTVEDTALFMAVKMGLFATSYTAKQVCTAAYQAYYEVEQGQVI